MPARQYNALVIAFDSATKDEQPLGLHALPSFLWHLEAGAHKI